MTRVLFLSAVCLPPVTAISYAQHGTVLFQPFFFQVSSVEGELREVHY